MFVCYPVENRFKDTCMLQLFRKFGSLMTTRCIISMSWAAIEWNDDFSLNVADSISLYISAFSGLA